MRLCDWKISSAEKTFAYAGHEVELSVWDTERAFTSPTTDQSTNRTEGMKRKRGNEYLPGEIWRAKNVRRVA